MEVVFHDGFDGYLDANDFKEFGKYHAVSNAVTSSVTRTGVGKSLSASSGQLVYDFKALLSGKYLTVGFDFRLFGTVPAGNIISLGDTYTYTFFRQITLYINASRQLEIRRGNTVLATGPTIMQVDKPYWVEFNALVDNASGMFEVLLDGSVEIVKQTGVDTQSRVTNTVAQFIINGFPSATCYIDDLYVLSDTVEGGYLGEVQSISALISSDDPVQLSRSGGASNYENISQDYAGIDDSTYVHSDIIGNKDVYGLSTLPAASIVHAVTVDIRAFKDSSATRSLKIKPEANSSTVEQSVPLSQEKKSTATVFTTRDGTNPWTPADLAALKLSIEIQ